MKSRLSGSVSVFDPCSIRGLIDFKPQASGVVAQGTRASWSKRGAGGDCIICVCVWCNPTNGLADNITGSLPNGALPSRIG